MYISVIRLELDYYTDDDIDKAYDIQPNSSNKESNDGNYYSNDSDDKIDDSEKISDNESEIKEFLI